MITFLVVLSGVLAQTAQIQPPGAEESVTDELPLFSGALVIDDALPHAMDAGWEGDEVCELLQESEDLRMFKCTFEPGQGHEKHWHPAHIGYVTEGGKMRITDESGTRVREFPTGLSWQSGGVTWHDVVNVGETTSSYVILEAKEPRR